MTSLSDAMLQQGGSHSFPPPADVQRNDTSAASTGSVPDWRRTLRSAGPARSGAGAANTDTRKFPQSSLPISTPPSPRQEEIPTIKIRSPQRMTWLSGKLASISTIGWVESQTKKAASSELAAFLCRTRNGYASRALRLLEINIPALASRPRRRVDGSGTAEILPPLMLCAIPYSGLKAEMSKVGSPLVMNSM